MKKNIKKNGFITLEAAIFLPVFIIGILTIAYLMKYIFVQENIIYSVCDEAKEISKNAYIIKAAPFSYLSIEKRVEIENKNIEEVETENYRYLYSGHGLDGLIMYEVGYWMDIKLPIQLYKGFKGKETVVFRGLIGIVESGDVTSFDEMEKDIPSDKVWIFPTAGKKYHTRDCPYISVYPTEGILTTEIKNKYHSCPICDSKNIEIGNLVYYFENSGEAYHSCDCPTVNKYVIEIEKDIAVKKGYVPCSKCGGE
jgi:hypothetical protein